MRLLAGARQRLLKGNLLVPINFLLLKLLFSSAASGIPCSSPVFEMEMSGIERNLNFATYTFPTLILLTSILHICRKSDEARKPQPITSDKNLAEWVTSSSLISTWNAEVIRDRPISEKGKLKAQAREAQKIPAAKIVGLDSSKRSTPEPHRYSFEVARPTVDNERSTPEPPLHSFQSPRCSSQVNGLTVDNDKSTIKISPRKPLSQNFQRDVETESLEFNANEKRPKVR